MHFRGFSNGYRTGSVETVKAKLPAGGVQNYFSGVFRLIVPFQICHSYFVDRVLNQLL